MSDPRPNKVARFLRPARVFLWVAVALVGVGLGLLLRAQGPRSGETAQAPGAIDGSGQAEIGGPFALIDHNGRAVTQADFRGRYMLIYFGYASCPDVCPLSLARLSAALQAMGPAAERIQPVFITVDPARDTADALKTYLSFDPRILGLTGTAEQIAAAAEAYRVYFARVEDPGSALGYTMDHTSLFYLMDPDGRFVRPFADDTPPEALARALKAAVSG